MKKILVTGGTGKLGKQIVNILYNEGYQVTILSTKDNRELPHGASLLVGDLTVPKSLENKLNNFQIVIHCASNPKDSENVDYKGTANLLRAIDSEHMTHFLYISIVGVDKSPYPYYQSKHMAERVTKESKLPFTIIRITQFHEFILHRILGVLIDFNQSTLNVPKGMAFQPIAIKDAANIISTTIERPQYTTIEIGGPEILSINEIIKTYITHLGKSSEIGEYLSDDNFYNLFTTGKNLSSNGQKGCMKWKDFVKQLKY